MKTPKFNRDEIKDIRISTIVSKLEYDVIKKKADEIGVSMSTIVRMAIKAFLKGEN